jgi:hypothetical protein
MKGGRKKKQEIEEESEVEEAEEEQYVEEKTFTPVEKLVVLI